MKYRYRFQPGTLAPDHYRIEDANDDRVATCYLEENARLVVELMNRGAAAPDLLEACKAAAMVMNVEGENDVDEWNAVADQLEAAIAAAEGGTS